MVQHVLCVGGEDHSLRIPFLKSLQASGIKITALGTGNGRHFESAGIAYRRYYFERFLSVRGHAGAIRDIARIVRESRPDLVQTFDTKPNILVPIAIRGRVPIVRTINGMGLVFSSNDKTATFIKPVYRALQRLAGIWASATVFQNASDAEYFQSHRLLGNSVRYLVAGSGIDIAECAKQRESAESRQALRTSLGLDDGTKVVLTISRLTKHKGIPALLKAAALLCAKRSDVKFLLVGPRESEGSFAIDQAEIERHSPYVVWNGFRSDIQNLLSVADVFAFPSEYREGMPRVLLEAGLAGVPIVATRVPGCADLVKDHWNGYLVDPGDHSALADRILTLLDDPGRAARMGARSVAVVEDKFSLDHVVAQYLDIYERVLGYRNVTRVESLGAAIDVTKQTGNVAG